ncbi:MAG: putative rane protein [Frankiaceae bacterium]|jgi:putative membrane protein|nr:putative rane protein [Frankiaceae bacterium]
MKRASRLTILALPAAATLMLPSIAWAADGVTSNTLRATIGGDGSVKSVTSLAGNGTSTPYSGDLPITLSISRTVQGDSSTYTYHVENTFSKTQKVTYTDTQGVKHTTSATVQLPLVAQLGVTLPKSFTNVSAPTAVVTTDPDGTNRILWNLVLFSPLGSPTQDETFTVTGTGAPTSELVATTVNPATTAGLSKAQQDATASSQQDDFWQGYANGGNSGLTQLASGTASMIAGLKKLSTGAHDLNTGLKTAQDGANKLDAGTTSAYDGSKKLTTGIGQIHTGNKQLAGGVAQIQAGLDALNDPSTGLASAVTGLQAIQGGIAQIIAGIGPTGSATTPGLLDALGAVDAGLKGSLTSLTTLAAGLTCASNTIKTVVAGAAAGTTPTGCASAIPVPLAGIADPFSQAVLVGTSGAPGVALQLDGATAALTASLQLPTVSNPSTLPAAIGAVEAVMAALSHAPTTPADPTTGGIKEVLQFLNGNFALGKAITGLQTAVAGIGALDGGNAAILTGANKLSTGSGAALTGSQSLTSGLSQLATGQHQVATGLPAAVDGSDQIAGGIDQVLDGATQVNGGILSVQTGAVGPLNTQLLQGSQNQKKQVAIVDAAAALAAQAPGGAGTSYVLTQFNPKLAAVSSPAKSGSSHTGRNVGIGLGGFAALVIAVVAGFALGRRSQVATAVG